MENWKTFSRVRSEYQIARRRTFLKIDLDVLTKNVAILNKLTSSDTDIIAVVKGNAYGHGSVEVCRHLREIGVCHFAVASPWEGIELRRAGIDAYIQVFGNACEEEISDLIEYDLTPTTGSLQFLSAWSECLQENERLCPDSIYNREFDNDRHGMVVIKVDTGMSRNGCPPDQLDNLVTYCNDHQIKVHSIMSHFACAWDNHEYTSQQLDTFKAVAKKYRARGIKLHAANSAGTLNGYGTDLDFIRPGIALYGLPPDTTENAIDMYEKLGLHPILSWKARPNLVKTAREGQTVGYDNTYRCEEGEILATISVGYADGYNRLLSGKGFITTDKGSECPVIGRVSMDAISVRLPSDGVECDDFYIIKDDFSSINSVVKLSQQLRTITYEVTTCLAARLPRVYTKTGRTFLGKTF